ncbi:MAG: HPF/RaiA family ribosome-associated protein [bacterium]|nr:HPF/RaiA family ribosome-associated protein [bacterium]MDZ4299355.1 HPF/RaiA family ribosome-associated protein [Candidatus Sungbacteria bacterium]
MRTTIRQKDLEMTPSLAEYIEQKIVRPVRKHLRQHGEASDGVLLDLEVGRTTHHHHKGLVYRASAGLTLQDGKNFRVEAVETDIRVACDAVGDELTREIVHHKGRTLSLLKRSGRRAKQYLRIDPVAWFSRGKRERDEGE